MAASDAFYQEVLVDVNAVLDEFGTSYTVRAQGTYDDDELEIVEGATRSVVGLVATQNDKSALGIIAFPVTETSAGWVGTKNLLLKADAAPQPGEEVQVDGKWYPLSKLVPIKPADIIVLYILDVTR